MRSFWASASRRARATLVAVIVVIMAVTGWRWHETHLPIPYVPSTWVSVDPGNSEVTMFTWTVTGRTLSGIYAWDEVTRSGCIVAPFAGSINGSSVTLTVNYFDGSGSTQWWGSVNANHLLLGPGDPQAVKTGFLPRPASTFTVAVAQMHLPTCDLSAAGGNFGN